jgi:hypothetical protein
MKRLFPLAIASLMLVTAPAIAQTADSTDNTDQTSNETDGNFSRNIPAGQETNLTEQEISDFQARLDAAETPQERNTVRQELHNLNQQRHTDAAQEIKEQKAEDRGLFGNMAADFKDIMSGKAARDAKAENARSDNVQNQNNGQNKSQNNGKSNDRGNGKSNSGGGNGGGNSGGGNGHSK